MIKYEEKILVLLAEKYRSSKKDSGTNVIRRRTRVLPSQFYKNYNRNSGDIRKIEAINEAAENCRKRGFVTFETEGFSNEIRCIYLVDEKINEIEDYLGKTYGYESKNSKRCYIEKMILEYQSSSLAADLECRKLQNALDRNQIPANFRQIEQMLKALAFIENNHRNLYLREASMMIYGNSKCLEEKSLLHAVCQALRTIQGKPCREDERQDDILEDYHIKRANQRLCVKGKMKICFLEKEMDIGILKSGAEIFDDELENIKKIYVQAEKFITVENYTAWRRIHRPDTVFFYLGGYVTHSQCNFLKKIHDDNPQLSFMHFGDIDAGGFYIHNHLCQATGIPFSLFQMSRNELSNPRYRSCLNPLTDNDRTRLLLLEQKEPYRETIAWMLEHNCKLEQEIISCHEQDDWVYQEVEK